MAINRTLQYHEDTTKKRSLNDNDIKFLMELQKEMNTQNTTGVADPRFWVIKGSKRVKDSKCPTDFDVYIGRDCKGTGTEEVMQYINEQIFTDWNNENSEEGYDEYCEMVIDDSGQLKIVSREDGEVFEYKTLEEMNDFFFSSGWGRIRLIGYSYDPVIYPNTMFLTKKAAREYLEQNRHRYSADAYPCCMCAWRSPEVWWLWKIIREVKWDELR